MGFTTHVYWWLRIGLRRYSWPSSHLAIRAAVVLRRSLAVIKSKLYNESMSTTPYTTDTSAEAMEVQLECLRQMSPQERIRRTFAMSRRIKQMAFEAIRRRHPEFNEQQVKLKFIELTYGTALATEVSQWLKERSVERAG